MATTSKPPSVAGSGPNASSTGTLGMRKPAALAAKSGAANSGVIGIDEETFVQSFELVPPVAIYSARDLNDIMVKIKDGMCLAGEDWEKKVESLRTLRAVVLAGAVQYDEFPTLLRNLEIAMQGCVADLRSQVVREACITVAFLSQELKVRFDHFTETIFINLVNLIPNSAKVMASSGIVAIRFIIQYTHSPRLIPLLTSTLTSKSNVTRRYMYEFLVNMFQNWPTNILEKHLGLLQETLKKGVGDADQDARAFSRTAFHVFSSHFPDQAESLLQSIEPSKRKLIERDMNSAGTGTGDAGVALNRLGGSQGSLNSTAPISSSSTTSSRSTSSKMTGQEGTGRGRRVVASATLNMAQRNRIQSASGPSGGDTLGRSTVVKSGVTYLQGDSRGRPVAKKMISQSQPTSREVSPSSRAGYLTYGVSGVGGPGVAAVGSVADRTGSRSRIARSQGTSREGSPSRLTTAVGNTTSPGGYPVSMVATDGAGAYASLPRRSLGSSAASPGISMWAAGQRAKGALVSGLDTEQVLADALVRGQRRYDQYDSDDNASETSSICSERSNNKRQSQQQVFHPADNVTDILTQLNSSQWSDKKDGLVNLQNFMRSGQVLCVADIRKFTDVFNKLFYDTQSKQVVPLFMDTLQLFIKAYNAMLRDWLYVLLVRLLTKQANEQSTSHQKSVQDTLFVVRSNFPLDLQLQLCCKYAVDNVQTPSLKVKACLLEYMKDILLMVSPDVINDPTPDFKMALCRVISWSTEPKSSEVRRTAARVIIKMFDLNKASFTQLTQTLPRTFQERANAVLHNYTQHPADLPSAGDTNGVNCGVLTQTQAHQSQPVRKHSLPSYALYRSNSLRRRQPEPLVVLSPAIHSHQPSLQQHQQGQPQQTLRSSLSRPGGASELLPPDQRYFTAEEVSTYIRQTAEDIQSLTCATVNYDQLEVNQPPRRGSTSGVTGSPLRFMLSANMGGVSAGEMKMQNSYPDLRAQEPDHLSASSTGGEMRRYNPTFYQQQQQIPQGYPPAGLPLNNYDQNHDEMPPDDAIAEILQELSNHNERHEQRKACMLRLMKMLRERTIESWEEHFKATLLLLLETLGDNESETRALALRVLQELLRIQPQRFNEYTHLTIVRILEAHKDSDKAVVRAAEECAQVVAGSLPQEICLRVLTPIVMDSEIQINLAALKMQAQVVRTSDTSLVEQNLLDIVPGLVKACNHDDSQVRKASVFCLVEISMKIGERIWHYLQDLNSSKIRLLKLYIKRTKENSAAAASGNASPSASGSDFS